ncbi:hypothetical protein [Haladaptatus halobius]|uniref:hypothetical protein n=1 Tax=Haladaptatus halobius TaxID=2884875 RepID=UPI001D0A8DA7|nr:hypothetical protein [Haladaptatus halobius]
MADDKTTQDEQSNGKTLPFSQNPRKELSESVVPLFLKILRIGGAALWAIGWLAGAFLWAIGWVVMAGLSIGQSIIEDETTRTSIREWFLLEGNRWTIIGSILAMVFLGSIVLGMTQIIGVQNGNFVTTMFSTIIAGLFSFVPIVIGINQLALARLFGAPGTPTSIRGKFDSLSEFRIHIEEMTPDTDVSPTKPSEFLLGINRIIIDRGSALDEISDDNPNVQFRREIDEYLNSIVDRIENIDNQLQKGDPSVFELLLSLMNGDYSDLINTSRRIQKRYAETLSETAIALLDDLREVLVATDVLREYFKIIYFQQELAKLSRFLAYSGVAAVLTSIFIVMLYSGDSTPSRGLGFLLLISLSLTVAVAPFVILFSYVLRIATIVKRSAAPGVFSV